VIKKVLFAPIPESGVANIKNAPDLGSKGKNDHEDNITRFFHAGGAD
jgi:hypothetical protein